MVFMPIKREIEKLYKFGCVLTAASLVVFFAGKVSAEEKESIAETRPPIVRYLELGGEYTHFTNDYGDGNSQFMAYSLSRENDFLLRFDLGRAARFGEQGMGCGASLTAYLPDGHFLGFGGSTGTGKAVFPKYRLDAFFGRGFLAEDNLQLTLGFIHEESKDVNKFDRYACALTWYAGPHWILGAHFNYDVGQPGDTITKSGGVGAMVGTWEERYVGASVEFGDVNYTRVGPSSYLVDYEQILVKAYFTEYFGPKAGMNLRLDWGSNDFYDLYGASLSFFWVR
jgi:YaiO family outer membrane protein